MTIEITSLVVTAFIAGIAFYIRYCFRCAKSESQARNMVKAHCDYWLNHILTAEQSTKVANKIIQRKKEGESLDAFLNRIQSIVKEQKEEFTTYTNQNLKPDTLEVLKNKFYFTSSFSEDRKTLKNAIIEDKLYIPVSEIKNMNDYEIYASIALKHQIIDVLHFLESITEESTRWENSEQAINFLNRMIIETAITQTIARLLSEHLATEIKKPFKNKLVEKIISPL